MSRCYQLSKGVYQDDQLAKEFIHVYQLPKDTYGEIPCYFLMEDNLIHELLNYNRPMVTINWQINPNGTINFEKSTIDIDGLLAKTPSQNPSQTIKPYDYNDPRYYQYIMRYLEKPKTIPTKNIPLNQHLFILGRLQPAWYDNTERMIYQTIQ